MAGAPGGAGGGGRVVDPAAEARAKAIREAREARKRKEPPEPRVGPPAAPAPPQGPAGPPPPKKPSAGDRFIDDALKDLDAFGGTAFANPFLEPKLWKATIKLGTGIILKGFEKLNALIPIGDFIADLVRVIRTKSAKLADLILGTPALQDEIYDASLEHQEKVDALLSVGQTEEAAALPIADYTGVDTIPQHAPAPPALEPIDETKLQEGDQTVYAPRSRMESVDTLMPANLAGPIREALNDLAERVGDIDQYVADKLGTTVEQISRNRRFSGEQMDGLALALAQMENGKAFILGDQTGVGKGRIVAGLIWYAHRQGLTPVFVTAKPGLFADMFRDLYAVGFLDYLRERYGPNTDINPYITNDKDSIKDPDEDTGEMVSIPKPPRPGETESPGDFVAMTLAERLPVQEFIHENGRLPEEYHVVFTTYDQLKPPNSTNPWRDRHRDIEALMPRGFLALDESHTAAGDPVKTKYLDGVKVTLPTLTQYVRGLVAQANSLLYSSATWAKNMVSLGLYTRTDLGQLGDALATVGSDDSVPILQILSRNLARAGQMIRREKSYEGIDVPEVTAEIDMALADETTSGLRAIYDFDVDLQPFKDLLIHAIAGHGGVGGRDGAVGEGGAYTINFSNVMHNVVKHMLTSIKAKAAVEEAKDALRAGEKPIITISATYNAFLEDYVNDKGVQVGETFRMSFRRVFENYLKRTMRVTIKDAAGNKTHHDGEPFLAEVAPHMVDKLVEVRAALDALDIEALPAMPIDYIKAELEQFFLVPRQEPNPPAKLKPGRLRPRILSHDRERAQFIHTPGRGRPQFRHREGGDRMEVPYDVPTGTQVVVEELTGRPMVAEYLGPETYRYAARNPGQGAKVRAIGKFNRGAVHVLIMNRAAASGYSMHSSRDFVDQRKRRMIVLQPEEDVNDFMQILGRVNRTGQVRIPGYGILATPIPAEQRFMAALMRRLASLNANTSGGRKGSLDVKAVDPMNFYGNRAAAQMLEDDPELAADLFGERTPVVDLAKAVIARTAILPIERQKLVLDHLIEQYEQLVAQADEEGTNKLKASRKTVIAGPLARVELKPPDNGGAFGGAVYAAQMQLRVIRSPLSVEKVTDLVAEARKTFNETMNAELETRKAVIGTYRQGLAAERELYYNAEVAARQRGDDIAAREAAKQYRDIEVRMANATKTFIQIQAYQEIARSPLMPLYESRGSPSPGVGPRGAYTGVKLRKTGRNPSLASAVVVRVLNLESGRQSWIPMHQLVPSIGTGRTLPPLERRLNEAWLKRVIDERNAQPTSEKVWMVTGNAIGGVRLLPRSWAGVAFLEMPDGSVVESLSMRAGFDPGTAAASMPVDLAPAQIGPYLEWMAGQNQRAVVQTPDQIVRFVQDGSGVLRVHVASTGGRRIYTAPRIIEIIGGEGLTRTKGGQYATNVTVEQIEQIATFLAETFGARFADPTASAQARRFLTEGQERGEETAAVRRTKRVFDRYDLPPESRANYLRRRWVRYMNRLHEYQKGALEEGAILRDESDVVNRERLMHGRTRALLRQLHAEFEAPIIRLLAKYDISLERADRHLYARHAPSRNAVIEERQRRAGNEDPSTEGSGMSNDRAAEIIAEDLADAERAQGFRELGQLVDSMMEQSLLRAVQYGLITDDQFDDYMTQWEHYVPLRTTMDARGGRSLADVGREFGARGPEYRRAEGRTSLADSPLAYALQQSQRTILRGEKNRVGMAFLRFLRENKPILNFAENKKELEQLDEDGEPTGTVEWQWQVAENAIIVKERGKAVEIVMKDALVMRAMKRLGEGVTPEQLRWLQTLMRLYAKMVTQWDPDFIIRNAMRDYTQGLLHLEGEYPGISLKAWTPAQWFAARRALAWHHTNPGIDGDTDWRRAAVELARAGGLPGYFGSKSLEGRITTMGVEIEALRNRGAMKEAFLKLGDVLEVQSNAIEGAMRLVAFRALRERGVSREKAAGFVKELTVNFDQKGEYGPVINALFLFWNASAQGIYRSVGGLLVNKRMRKIAGLIIAFGALNGAIQRLMGGDDEDGIPFYDKKSPFDRDSKIIMMFPGGRSFTLPLPYVFNALYRLGDHASSVAMGAEAPGAALDSVLGLLASVINPFGQEKSAIQVITPTIADPLLSIAMNAKWHSGPVYPKTIPWLEETTPDSEKVWDRNREDLLHKFTRAVSDWTGGDETEGGSVLGIDTDWSPESLRFLTEYIFGGAGKFVSRGLSEASNAFTAQPVDWGNVPFARTIYSGPVGVGKNDDQRFYAMTDKVLAVPTKMKKARERNNEDRYWEIQDEFATEMSLVEDAEAARERVKDLRKEALEAETEADRVELLGMAREEMRAFNGLAWEAGLR